MANLSAISRPTTAGRWPDHQTVLRWHFYAGLLCIPFVIWLAATGSIYLFKPQVEAWLDRPYAGLVRADQRTAPSAEVRAALRAEPGTSLHGYQLPFAPGDAAQVLVGRGEGEIRVWVDPRSAAVLKAVPEDDRFMQRVFRLHGELMLGDKGSILVELAASWAFVMILTGLYLWWPRQTRGLGGLIYPRLGLGARLFWRDIHAVTAVWVSATTLILLSSGLPWAKSWGIYLAEIRHVAGSATLHQDWSKGRSADLSERSALSAAGLALQRSAAGSAGMDGMAGMRMADDPAKAAALNGGMPQTDAYAALDRLVPTVAARRLAFPVLISPPKTQGAGWTAHSEAQDRLRRETLVLNAKTGLVTSDQRFDQKPLVDQVVATGVAAHEGQLFGWPNQLANLTTASGLMVASLTAPILWWRRRSKGLGAPPVGAAEPRFSTGLLLIVMTLALLLPLFGLSLMCVAVIERLVFRRIPPLKAWLGLRDPSPKAAFRASSRHAG